MSNMYVDSHDKHDMRPDWVSNQPSLAGGAKRSPFRGHPISNSDSADPARLRADDVALPAFALIDEIV